MKRMHLTGGRLGLVLAVLAGVVLGAIFGQAGNVRAASTTVPKNKSLPTISGTAEVGLTLTATAGSWSGNPTSFHFAWSRCDTTGAACLAIGGATAKIYTPTSGDVGHTLRVSVTARNSSGTASATSAATAVVPTGGCPPGTGTILIGELGPPAQLVISGAKLTNRLTRASGAIHIRVAITACSGRAVQGANVYASAIPFNQFGAVQGTTAADGTVTLTEARRKGFPASTHQRLLAVLVRATQPNMPVVGGVSTRQVVAFPVF